MQRQPDKAHERHRRRLLDAIAKLSDGPAATAAPAQAEPAAPPVARQAERRQVTVMFADLVGYTALAAELGAEAMHALLDRFFARLDRAFEAHGGRIDKHIGDCAMAVFGAPVAHGNDAERALRTALAIGEEMRLLSADSNRPLLVCIGVAAGQVVASGTGSASHREYTMTGDSVNLASRLTQAAQPGEILVADGVWRDLAHRLDGADAGALSLKGFAEPVRAWRLAGFRQAAQAGRLPLVGRGAQLRQFQAALAECGKTGRGLAIHLRGEAGIGKTRLVEEFQRAAREAGFLCHGGLVLDFGTGAGRDAIAMLARGLIGLAHQGDAEAAALAAIDFRLVEPDAAPFLNDLLDLPQPLALRARYDAMDHAARAEGRRGTLARLVERASRRQPRLLVIKDLHWADASTLDYAARLGAVVAECPALLVLTSRVAGDPLGQDWAARSGGAPLLTIDLGPLRHDEAMALADTLTGAVERHAARCVERAAGNPLFLEQLLRHADQLDGDSVPGSVQSLVQARMDRLQPTDREALQAAAVLGQRFSAEALAHLLGQPGYTPLQLSRDLLVRPQDNAWLFAHALIRDAVYDTLLTQRRRDLHRRAAQWYGERDPVLQAEHLDRAGDPAAATTYLKAAQHQANAYRYEAALKLAERGLALANGTAERALINCQRGELLHDLADMPRAASAFSDALAEADEPAQRCRILLGLAAVKRMTDNLQGAFADLEAAANSVPQDMLVERARIHFLRGNLLFPTGDVAGCLAEHARSLALAR
ncbi:MAG: hypothetical protein FJX68_12980 [Alphaproteobacteria bacterium]|nr:hypothetical protein [Alphaproteobacteria bacterium]